MKRREFLRTAVLGGVGLGLAKPGLPTLAKLTRKPDSVLILGAGISGLTAALTLQDQGVPVTILEARSRVGGRIHTHTLDPESGLTVELGAEWIGASHSLIQSLCERFQLPLQRHTFTDSYYLGGTYTHAENWRGNPDWDARFEQLLGNAVNLSEADRKQLDGQDWWRYLKSQGIDDLSLELHELSNSTDFGETIRQVSALSALTEYADSSPNNEMDLKITGGNTRLPQALARHIGADRIHLNQTVTHVRQTSEHVEVACANGTTFTASHLICTLPVHAMLGIAWEPVLDADKAAALRALQYCRIAKSHILFDRRFWPSEDFSLLTDRLGHYFFHSTQGQEHALGALTSYATGDRAYLLSRLSENERVEALLRSLPPALVGDAQVKHAVIYDWSSDRYVAGAYALYAPGQWLSLVPTLTEPHRRVHFAGEYLSVSWQGFLEGAAETGQQVAQRLLGN